MRESQYQIPVSEIHSARESVQSPAAEVLSLYTETEAGSPEHAAVKEREMRIDWYRHEALTAPIPEPKKITEKLAGFILGRRRTPLAMDTLIDQESALGPAIFNQPVRFWLHPPVAGDAQGVRDWYFYFISQTGEQTIRYQSDADGFHKIYQGREYGFTEGEEARLYEAVAAYEQLIATQVYQR